MLSIYDGRQCLYQWETGRAVLVSSPIIERVLFSNITTPEALPVDVVEVDGVRLAAVPDELLQTSWDINASAICGEGCTRAELLIPVKARAKPAEYVYTPTEVHNYNSLAARIATLEKAKLSDFENDLWYTRREDYITLTPADFELVETAWGDTVYSYRGEPRLDWVTSPENLGFCLTFKDPETGEAVAFTEEDVGGFTDMERVNDTAFVAYGELPLEIYSGFDPIASDAGGGLVEENAFHVQFWDDISLYPFITLVKVDSKKVPIEYCDTSEIEAEINTLAEEVWDL